MSFKFDYQNLSISQRILLVAIGLSIALVIIVLTFAANQISTSKNAIKENVNKNRSFAVIEKIDRNFYERFGDVQAFAYNRLALEAIDSGRATRLVQDFINTMISYYVLYDIMMIVDVKGKVVAVNTIDKNGVPVKTEKLIGQDFSNESWFRTCVSKKGPDGGAWYSDFLENSFVAKIYNSKGWGMGFAAPVRDNDGEVIGVWYNYANWSDVTQDIRRETENLLKQDYPEAFILITDKEGLVIDAADESLVKSLRISPSILAMPETSFTISGRKVNMLEYIYGYGKGRGAYTYKGNGWIAYTFVPKDDFSLAILYGELFTFSFVMIGVLCIGVLLFFWLSRSISSRINSLRTTIAQLSQGELPEVNGKDTEDEVGQMTRSVRSLIKWIKGTSEFANEVGKGNLESGFQALSTCDVLGNSLLVMRENLLRVRTDEEKRKWVTQGLAEFGERTRKSTGGLVQLCDDVLVFICKYVDANQGAIFIKDDASEEPGLEMISCYAWNRKKFNKVKIENGEGLIGQAWLEGEMIYLTSVPDNFVKISSGLGEANPGNICILPLKNTEEVLGVLEIASFRKFKEHEIDFLKKVCDSLTSSLASERVNERTKKLLDQTQRQAEALRAQEEEMRQSLEEMQSTQEDFSRRETEYQDEIRRLKEYSMNGNGVVAH